MKEVPTLRNECFISLYAMQEDNMGKVDKGHLMVEDFLTKDLTAFRADVTVQPPNFESACVFKVMTIGSDAQMGDPIRFGDRVVLIHRSTDKYLCRQEMSLLVQTELTPLCHWRMIPRFRLKSSGDNIRFNDQIIIESALGQDPRPRVQLHPKSSKLTCSNNSTTGLQMKMFASHLIGSTDFRTKIKGGDFVRLFHQETYGFLSVQWPEGPASEQPKDPNIYVEVLEADENPLEFRDISSLWQVELVKHDRNGGRPVNFTDQIRLRSAVSKSYLDLEAPGSGGSLSPNAERDAPTTGLQLVSSTALDEDEDDDEDDGEGGPDVEQGSGLVDFSDFFFVRSTSKAKWLHIDKYDSHTIGLKLVGLDQKEFVATQPQDGKVDSDAFTFLTVSREEISDYFQMDGVKADLAAIADPQLDLANIPSAVRLAAQRALDTYMRFCTRDEAVLGGALAHDGIPVPRNQNLLNDLDIAGMCMAVMMRVFEGKPGNLTLGSRNVASLTQLQDYNGLCLRAARVMRQMCKGNEKIGLQVGNKHYKTLVEMAGILIENPKVAWKLGETLEIMFKDNQFMLREISEELVAKMVGLVAKSRRVDDLVEFNSLLGAFCSVDDEPLPVAQDALCKVYVDSPLMLKLQIDSSGTLLVQAPQMDKAGSSFAKCDRNWVPLADYCKVADQRELVESVLDLLAETCRGRNADSQRMIMGLPESGATEGHPPLCNFEMFMVSLEMPGLPQSTLSSFVNLACELCIDRDPLQERMHVLNRMMSDLADERASQVVHENIRKLFSEEQLKQLLDWIQGFLEAHRLPLDADLMLAKAQDDQAVKKTELKLLRTKQEGERHQNELMRRVLLMVEMLVEFSFYQSTAQKQVITRVLMDLLWRSQPRDDSELSASGPHLVVMEAKAALCRTLLKLRLGLMSSKLSELLEVFKAEVSGGKKELLTLKPSDSLEENRLLRDGINDPLLEATKLDPRFEHANFVMMMLDVTRYEHDELAVQGLDVLMGAYCPKGLLLDALSEVTLVVQEAEIAFLQSLRIKVQEFEEEKDMVGIMEWLCTNCLSIEDDEGGLAGIEESPSVDSANTSADIASRIAGPSAGGWEQGMKTDPDKYEPNRLHQDMMQHESIHIKVLEAMQEVIGMAVSDEQALKALQDPDNHRLFSLGFKFLSFLAWDNDDIKDEMADSHFKFFVRSCKFGIGAEDTLMRVLEENQDVFDEKVELDDVELLTKFLIRHERCRSASYMEMLYRLVAPKGRAEKEMQDMVGEVLLDMTSTIEKLDGSEVNKHEALFQVGGTDLSAGRFLEAITNRYISPADTPQGFDVEFFQKMCLVFRITGDDNTEIRKLVQKEVPLEMAAYPILHFADMAARGGSAIMPLRIKGEMVDFLKDVWVFDIGDDELQPTNIDDEEDLDGNGISDVVDNGLKILDLYKNVITNLAAEFDFARAELDSKALTRKHVEESDEVMIGAVMPLVTNLLRHSVQHVVPLRQNDYDDEVEAFSASVVRLMVSLTDYLHFRMECRDYDIAHELEQVSRNGGAEELKELKNIFKVAVYEATFRSDTQLEWQAAVEAEHIHWSGKGGPRDRTLGADQKQGPPKKLNRRMSVTTLELAGMGDHGRPHEQQQMRSVSEDEDNLYGGESSMSLGSTAEGPSKPTRSMSRSASGMARRESKTWNLQQRQREAKKLELKKLEEKFLERAEGEKVRDSLEFFKAQCETLFEMAGKKDWESLDEWMDNGPYHINFAEFWDLVAILQYTMVEEAVQQAASLASQKPQLKTLQGASKTVTRSAPALFKSKGKRLPMPISSDIVGSLFSPRGDGSGDTYGSLDNGVNRFNAQACLTAMFEHFRHFDDSEDYPDAELDEQVENVMLHTLQVLTATLMCDEDDVGVDGYKALQRELCSQYVKGGAADVVMFLMTLKQLVVIDLGVTFGAALLDTSPPEIMILDDEDFSAHPHAQAQFLEALSSGPEGRGALIAMRDWFTELAEDVRKRELEEADEKPDILDLNDELQESRVVRGILNLIQLMCEGCYKPMQDFVRVQDNSDLGSINLLQSICGLIGDYRRLVERAMNLDLPFLEPHTPDMSTELAIEIGRQEMDLRTMASVFGTLNALVGGPNKENQREILLQDTPEPIRLILYFMKEQTDGNEAAHSIVQLMDLARSSVKRYVDNFDLKEGPAGDFVQPTKSNGKKVIARLEIEKLEHLEQTKDALADMEDRVKRLELDCVGLLNTLAEGRRKGDEAFDQMLFGVWPRTKHTSTNMFTNVLINNLYLHFKDVRWKDPAATTSPEDRDFDQDDECCFVYYVLLKTIAANANAPHGNALQDNMNQWLELVNPKELEENIGRIEVVAEDGSLNNQYFQIPRTAEEVFGNDIIRDTMTGIMEEVRLMPAEQKIKEFLRQAEDLMEHLFTQASYARSPITRVLTDEKTIGNATFLVAVVLNLWILLDLEDRGFTKTYARIVAVVHTLLSGLKLGSYMMNRAPSVRRHMDEDAKQHRPGPDRLFFYVQSTLNFVLVGETMYTILYFLFAVLGLTVDLHFHVFHIMDIVFHLSVMMIVVDAIFSNLAKLAGAFLLTFIFIYVLTIFGLKVFGEASWNYADALNSPGADEEVNDLCTGTMLECLRDNTFLGIVEAIRFNGDKEFTVEKWAFSMVYYILILNIMLAIVSGIIIDSFGEMRDFRQQLADAAESVCFVCDVPRGDLEATSDAGFEGHLESEHNPWHYAMMMYYIRQKMIFGRRLTGSEIQFANMWNSGQLPRMWPNGRASCIEAGSSAEGDQESELQALTEEVQKTEKLVASVMHPTLQAVHRLSKMVEDLAKAA